MEISVLGPLGLGMNGASSQANSGEEQTFFATGVDTLSSVKPNLRISGLHFEKLVTIKRHVVMQHAVKIA
ncbi:hypothetical protein [Nitrosomonas sp. ANs5]|uniref:hypothetical protein n=1 Tax=Nitrosomonas sp. ANs5 TaxID=3423941 RepID=UPI003D33083A